MKNTVELFLDRVRRSGPKTALRWKADGAWRECSWLDLDRAAREIAAGLQTLGVVHGERVGLLSSSRPAWMECDVGILMAGAVTVPLYQSNVAHECAYVLVDSGAKVVFAEDPVQVRKLVAERAQLGNVVRVVYFDAQEVASGVTIEAVAADRDWVMSLAELRERGRARLAEAGRLAELEASWRAIEGEDLFTIVYTSGTTGPPKGVVLTHANLLATCAANEKIIPFDESDEQLLFLPLAHIFAKALEWATVLSGSRLTFAESLPQLRANMLEVRPTFMCSVPRMLEKVYLGIIGNRNAAPPLAQKIFDWAFSVGRKVSPLRQQNRRLPLWLVIQNAIAHKLVFAKIHAALGGRMRFMVSGGAPLSQEIAEFFHAAGILVCEGWGLTETCAGVSVNRPDDYAFGTVGKPIDGAEVVIAPDGEILVRGPTVMRGYWNNPEATAEVIDADGWFHTGDIGLFVDGRLKITDRKKDIIVNAGGKNIAPQNLENFLKATPYISQVMVHGDKRPYLVALVTLNEENTTRWAATQGLSGKSVAQLSQEPKVRALVGEYIDKLNAREPSYSSIKKFAILPADLTQDTGELTPTLKVKRKFTYEKFKTVVDSLYETG